MNVTKLRTKAELEAEAEQALAAAEDVQLLEMGLEADREQEEPPLRMSLEDFLNSPRLP